jgi:SAM-dependent methyltransferase
VRAKDYKERLARKSSARATPFDVDWLVTRHLVQSLRHASASYASGLLLDVGCGGRPYEPLFEPYVERYTGIDTPASTLSRADAAAVASHLPFADCAFDTVLCTEVLEHLSTPAACIDEIARVLRPGGHLILTTPQMWHLHEEPYDFFRFTRYGLAYLCRSAHLNVVEVRPHGGAWATIGLVLMIHLGSYVRSLCEWVARTTGSKDHGASAKSNDWQVLAWPFRLPIFLFNLFFGALDNIPHPGAFTADNMVVARKPFLHERGTS